MCGGLGLSVPFQRLSHKSSASKIEETGVGSGQTFTLVTPELSVPGVPPDVLQPVLSQASTANV